MNPKSKESIQEIVSRRIRMLRMRKGLGRRDLAKTAGLHYTYIAKIEAGKKIPTVKVLCRLAAALQIEPVEFLIPQERRRKLSQKQTELIKIVKDSSLGEIEIIYVLVNALNKKKS